MDPMNEANAARPTPESIDIDGAGGVRLRLHDFGGVGTPVLAAHATGFAGPVWTPLARALDACHVVAPDFRAHGGSPVPVGADLDWARFADDVLTVVDACGWTTDRGSERPIGIGHSMGGAALLMAELRRPGTFSGLWVYEPIVFPPDVRAMVGADDNPLAGQARRRRTSFPSRADAQASYASKPPMDTFDAAALAGYVEAGFVDVDDGTVRLACEPENEAVIYTTAKTCDAFENLGALGCPVTVVRGEFAEMTPAALAERVAGAAPHGRLVTHDELSHFGPMEDPVGLAAEIAAFIDDKRG